MNWGCWNTDASLEQITSTDKHIFSPNGAVCQVSWGGGASGQKRNKISHMTRQIDRKLTQLEWWELTLIDLT